MKLFASGRELLEQQPGQTCAKSVVRVVQRVSVARQLNGHTAFFDGSEFTRVPEIAVELEFVDHQGHHAGSKRRNLTCRARRNWLNIFTFTLSSVMR